MTAGGQAFVSSVVGGWVGVNQSVNLEKTRRPARLTISDKTGEKIVGELALSSRDVSAERRVFVFSAVRGWGWVFCFELLSSSRT